jgi:hypothetical protein
VLLQGAAEVEHHEIGVYENLILNARAKGRNDVAEVQQRNLDDETHTLKDGPAARRDGHTEATGRHWRRCSGQDQERPQLRRTRLRR